MWTANPSWAVHLDPRAKTFLLPGRTVYRMGQQLTRFNPGNAHVCGLSRHGALVGSGELDDDQTKARGTQSLPRFGPFGRVTTYVLLV
jgi:hypothetical protein